MSIKYICCRSGVSNLLTHVNPVNADQSRMLFMRDVILITKYLRDEGRASTGMRVAFARVNNEQ